MSSPLNDLSLSLAFNGIKEFFRPTSPSATLAHALRDIHNFMGNPTASLMAIEQYWRSRITPLVDDEYINAEDLPILIKTEK